jgi:hypothetical protein
MAAGIEVRAVGDQVAIAFAQSEHQAALVRIEPTTMSPTESTVAHSVEPIRRVTPVWGKRGRLGLSVDMDRRGDPLHGRQTVPLDPPLQVGLAGGQLAWAPLGRGIAGRLWPVEGDGPVEALRGVRQSGDSVGVMVAFRHSGAIWVGRAEGAKTLSARGELTRLAGLGPSVGSPAIAVNEGVVVAAWADRPSPDNPWQLRWVLFKAGEAPGDVSTFELPPGGKGEQAMSPGLAAVPGGRFLLVWTEGPAAAHAVRALTLSTSGGRVGEPLGISSEGVNAGQGQAAVVAAGRGVVAFLESSEDGFRVAATPIACGL